MIKQGFTLIEILIALLAASIISIMSFDYLSNSVFLKERVEQNINLNNKHFNAINILRLDLMQSVPFQMKDTTGRDLNVSFICLLYTSPSPRDMRRSRMPSSA